MITLFQSLRRDILQTSNFTQTQKKSKSNVIYPTHNVFFLKEFKNLHMHKFNSKISIWVSIFKISS